MNKPNWRKGRRQARVAAFQALFALDARKGGTAESALEHALDAIEVTTEQAAYARRLVDGVLEAQADLDALIQASAPSWPVSQLARVDRVVLRLALYELVHEPAVPQRVAIDEAIELAKEYGSINSSRFVHGVLGTISAGLPTEAPPAGSGGLHGPAATG